MIHRISLSDCLEPTAPPARVLNLGVLDDTVFVSICDVEQGSRHETHAEVADISVSLPALIDALLALYADAEREHLRPLERQGTLETRLAGERLTAVPSVFSLLTARTRHERYTPAPEPPTPPEGGTTMNDPENEQAEDEAQTEGADAEADAEKAEDEDGEKAED